MQYGGGNQQQQRMLNMMMQARQQQAARQQQQQPQQQQPPSAAAAAASLYSSYPPQLPLPSQHQGHPFLHGQHQQQPQRLPLPLPQQQQQQGEPTFVTRVGDNDVLLGRGTPCAENEGNVRFRKLVKERKMEYVAAEKRMRKDAIAREILEVIASRGGKFLRKVESQSELHTLGVPFGITRKEIWAIVDEDTQVQKVKQALRNKDDAGDLPPPPPTALTKALERKERRMSASAGAGASGSAGSSRRTSYVSQDMTNRFPRGVADESYMHKADYNLQMGESVLERASSGSSTSQPAPEEGKASPKMKGLSSKGISSAEKDLMMKSAASKKSSSFRPTKTSKDPPGMGTPGRGGSEYFLREGDPLMQQQQQQSQTMRRLSGSALGDYPLASSSRRFSAGMGEHPMAASLDLVSPSRRGVLAGTTGLPPGLAASGFPGRGGSAGLTSSMMRRHPLWDASTATATEGELRNYQELQRLRMMRDQRGSGMTTGAGGVPRLPSGPPDLMTAGMIPPTGAAGLASDYEYRELMLRDAQTAEYRQMQQLQAQQQQLQAHRMAAAATAREQALRGASLGAAGATSLHPMAAGRQLPVEQVQATAMTARRGSGSSLGDMQQRGMPAAGGIDTTSKAGAASTTPATGGGRPGADSAGERAIGIAQAMKRAEAFSPAESLEASHIETLILSVMCSHGLPIWSPEAHTRAFLPSPTFAKRLDWAWGDFADSLKRMASESQQKKKNQPAEAKIAQLAIDAALVYQRNPKELAIKTIMLMERLRRHSSSVAGTTQRKQWSGLGMRVPLWLDRELSRWAMTLDIADPTGRPVPFSSTDFVAEHSQCMEDPAVVATAAFDPQLADDVVEQVALLTRLRSVFVKSKGPELPSKLKEAIKKAESAGEGWDDQPKGWGLTDAGEGTFYSREFVLCDRLLMDGFSGVLASTRELGSEYQVVDSKKRYCPTLESLGLTKSAIQQRVSQITRELHVLDESQDMQRLLGDRMERLAKSVLRSGSASSESALDLLAGATATKAAAAAAAATTGGRASSSSSSSSSPKVTVAAGISSSQKRQASDDSESSTGSSHKKQKRTD